MTVKVFSVTHILRSQYDHFHFLPLPFGGFSLECEHEQEDDEDSGFGGFGLIGFFGLGHFLFSGHLSPGQQSTHE